MTAIRSMSDRLERALGLGSATFVGLGSILGPRVFVTLSLDVGVAALRWCSLSAFCGTLSDGGADQVKTVPRPTIFCKSWLGEEFCITFISSALIVRCRI